MEPAVRWALAAIGVIAAIVLVAIVVDLGPFSDEVSADELIAQGDEICAAAHEAFEDLQSEPPRTANDAEELTGQLLDIAEDEQERIDELDPPDELESALDRYLAGRADGIDLLARGVEAAEDHDDDAYSEAQARVARNQLDRRRSARRVGFKVCSKPLIGREALAEQAEAPTPSDPSAPPTVNNPPTATP
jgi:hypothetical protein